MAAELIAGFACLTKVALQQALQSLAVTGLVTSHLVDGVVDSIQAVLLGALGQVELAGGGAELAVNTPCQVDRKSTRLKLQSPT